MANLHICGLNQGKRHDGRIIFFHEGLSALPD